MAQISFSLPSDATAVTLGAAGLVNTYTQNNQLFPSLAALPGGGHVVTWTSDVQDGSSYGVFAQRYQADGSKLGGEFQVNTTTGSTQYLSAVTGLADGSFVVTWQSYGQDGNQYGIYGQRFDGNGPLGGEIAISQGNFDQEYPNITALADGGFLATWMSAGQDGSGWGIYGRRYDAAGHPLADEALINTTTANNQYFPSAAALAGGGHVVTWMSQDGSVFGIYGQQFAANGARLHGEFQISQAAFDQEYSSVTGLAGGGFVVTWSSQGQDGSGWGVYGRRYDAAGQALGDEALLTSTTSGDQFIPSVTALADGGFLVLFDDASSGNWQQRATRFGADGERVGGETIVAAAGFIIHDINGEQVAQLADGRVVATWYGAAPGDTSGTGIESRILTLGDDSFHGTAGAALAIPLNLALTGTGSVTLTGFPPGSSFNLGSAGPNGSWVIPASTGTDLSGLTITVPSGGAGTYRLHVTLDAQEASASSVTTGAFIALSAPAYAAPTDLTLAIESESGVPGDDVTNDTTPEIQGIAAPGDTVTLYEGITQLGQATADATTGAWHITSAALAHGSHTLVAVATSAGNLSSGNSQPLTVVIDTQPPTTGIASAALSDDSATAGDFITSIAAQTIAGTLSAPLAAGETVRVSTDGGTNWTAATTQPAVGETHFSTSATLGSSGVLKIEVVDAAGNAGPSFSHSYTVDSTAPDAPSISTLGGTLHSARPSITGTGEAGSTVELFDGALSLGTTTVGGDGLWSKVVTLTGGAHSLTAIDTDLAGNASTASLTLDLTNPLTTLYSLQGRDATFPTGASPQTLLLGTDGAIYSTAYQGGVFDFGTVFKLAAGSYAPSTLVQFQVDNGFFPGTGLVADAAGNFYGTTGYGGFYGQGTLYELSGPDHHTLTTLVNFNDPAGSTTPRMLLVDPAGNIYGTTQVGGSSHVGTVFRLSADHQSLTTLVTFSGGNGSLPYGGLVMDAAGNIFGTTQLGGTQNSGTVFEITSAGVFHLLHSFVGGTEGALPYADLALDANGTLYGTTEFGGDHNLGTIFKLSGANHTTLTTLASFDGTNGARPLAGLVLDTAGNLFGTARLGGTEGHGTIFELAAGSHTLTTLFEFSGLDGDQPYSTLVADAAGNLYSTTTAGGSHGWGTVFQLANPGFATLAAPAGLTLAPGSDSGAAGDSLTRITLPAFTGTGTPGTTVTLQAGGAALGSATVLPDGSWSLAPDAPLADGTYIFTVLGSDIAGHSMVGSSTVTLTIDHTASVAAITSAGGLSNAPTHSISGTVSDAHPGTTVLIYDNAGDTPIGSATVDGSGHWSTSVTLVGEGAHLLVAKHTDAAGNIGSSAPLVFTLDTTPPAAPLLGGVAPDTDIAGDAVTSAHTLSVTGTAEPGASIAVTVTGAGHSYHWSAIADASGAWTADGAGDVLADGAYTATAIATDAAGNVGPSLGSLPFTVFAGALTQVLVTYHGTLDGGLGNDDLSTSQGGATLNGNYGDDTLTGSGYEDSLHGGSGDDSLTASGGHSLLDGGTGDDTLLSSGYGDSLLGGDGDDSLSASGGNSTLEGGSGDNNIHADGWGNVITAGNGHNVITGNTGGGSITLGDGGNDVTTTGYGNHITTGSGDDIIRLGLGGGNVIDAGGGTDTVLYSGTSDQYRTIHNQDGSWTVQGPKGTDTLRHVETLLFADTAPTPPGPELHSEILAALQDGASSLGNVLVNDLPPPGAARLFVTGFHIEGHDYHAGDTATLAGNALFSIDADGNVTLDQRNAFDSLAAGATRALTFNYTVNTAADGSGLHAAGDASIELTGLNDTPTAGDDHLAPDVSGALGNVLANDHDPDAGDVLHVTSFSIESFVNVGAGTLVTLASGATFTVQGNGSVTLNQGHHYDSIAQALDIPFTYTVNDRADGSGLTATGDASITLQPLPVGTGSTQSTSLNDQVLNGTPGNDVLSATGWHETINGYAGDDIINGGNGQATIDAGDGNNQITVHGGANHITAGDGDNHVSSPDGDAHIHLGDGTETITLGGYGNEVEIGATPDGTVSTIIAGSGGAHVVTHEGLADGDVRIILAGHNNTVATGDGDNVVQGAQGGSSIAVGDGDNLVDIQGYGNSISTGSGHNEIHAGSGNDTVVSGGFDSIWLSGWGNVVDASGALSINVHGGDGNGLFIAPTAPSGLEVIFDFHANAGDHLRFASSAEGHLSFHADAGDLEVLVNGQEVVTLIGYGSDAAQAALLAQHSLVFG